MSANAIGQYKMGIIVFKENCQNVKEFWACIKMLKTFFLKFHEEEKSEL